MIDLHLHTTASDGLCEPDELVRLAHQAGIRTLSVTDHDTLHATEAVAACAARCQVEAIPGIEITAVQDDRDVHVLGYFLDAGSAELTKFLQTQRQDRLRRVEVMAERLAQLGFAVDVQAVLQTARQHPGRSVGRPQVARALVRAGHVATVREAFDRLLAAGRPAFIARRGASPASVIGIIRRAGGIASLAHPGLLGRDDLIPELARAGLGALEAYHSRHDGGVRRRYIALANTHDLALSGGSDFHGETTKGGPSLGRSTLPPEDFDKLRALLDRDQHAPSSSPEPAP